MALTTNQRTTVRNALITLADSAAGGFTDGGAITSAQWADRWLTVLDDIRAQTRSRTWYTTRIAPWIIGNLPGLNSTVRTAITNHCMGN